MAYFKEQGISQDYPTYCNLPIGVVMDARLLAEGEASKQKREEATHSRSGRRR